MPDMTQYTDEELFNIAGVSPSQKPKNMSSLSNEELFRIAGIQEPTRGGVFGKVKESKYQSGERNILGNIFERPAAAVRSAIQGKGYTAGAVNPTNVPRFQDIALDKFYGDLPGFPGKTAVGNVVSAGGMAADIATDPASLLGIMAGMAPGAKTAAQAVMATKPAQAISRFANLPISKTAPGRMAAKTGEYIGKGAKEIQKVPQYLSKSSADYVTTKVAPKAYQIYQNQVSKFTPYIQRFAEEKLKVPKTVIITVKRIGTDKASKVRQFYNDSTDAIYQKIQSGITQKDVAVSEAYNKSFKNIGNTDLIHLNRTYRSMQGFFKRIGYIDNMGNETTLAKGIAKDAPLGQVLNYYQSLKPQPNMLKQPGGINKFQWKLLRENLSTARRQERTFKREITTMLNSLHDDAEKAGVSGIKNARALARQNFDVEDNILSNTLIKERKLDKYQTFSEAEKRQLRDIEKYTGEKFVDDLDALTADRALDKLREYNPERFASDLNKAVEPKWTNYFKGEYRDLLGDKTDEIFNEVVGHRRGVKIKKGALIGTGVGVAGGGTISGIRRKVLGE